MHPPRLDSHYDAAGARCGLRGVPEDRRPLGASSDVHDLRPDRLLRLLAESTREPARSGGRRRDRPLGWPAAAPWRPACGWAAVALATVRPGLARDTSGRPLL